MYIFSVQFWLGYRFDCVLESVYSNYLIIDCSITRAADNYFNN